METTWEKDENALAQLARSQSRERAVQGVDLGEQEHILAGITTCKGSGRRNATIPDPSSLRDLGDQARDLCLRQAGRFGTITVETALVGSPRASITEAMQFRDDSSRRRSPGSGSRNRGCGCLRGWRGYAPDSGVLRP